jgi:hypothetical protein
VLVIGVIDGDWEDGAPAAGREGRVSAHESGLTGVAWRSAALIGR